MPYDARMEHAKAGLDAWIELLYSWRDDDLRADWGWLTTVIPECQDDAGWLYDRSGEHAVGWRFDGERLCVCRLPKPWMEWPTRGQVRAFASRHKIELCDVWSVHSLRRNAVTPIAGGADPAGARGR